MGKHSHTCSECGRWVSVRKSGKPYEHKRGYYGKVRCPGSDKVAINPYGGEDIGFSTCGSCFKRWAICLVMTDDGPYSSCFECLPNEAVELSFDGDSYIPLDGIILVEEW